MTSRRDVEDAITVVCHEHPYEARSVVGVIAEGVPTRAFYQLQPILAELVRLDPYVLETAYREEHRN